jgi:hypothetical protein
MLAQLWLPIILSAVALFFASFLSWMVLQLHAKDWLKLEKEDEFLQHVRQYGIQRGSYMFPGCSSAAEMKSPEYAQKWEQGPTGIMTVYGRVNMGKNLALTFLYFLVVCFVIAYLASIGIERGADFMTVFRFVSTAGLLAFLAAMVQHSIWFHNRIVGHVIESVAYAAIIGAIFAALWPS